MPHMNRRTLLALLALLPAPALADTAAPFVPTAQDRADIARVEAFLNTLRSFRARFLQVAPDGATSEGKAWLQRPGRLRFEYDPPHPDLLVAGFGSAVWFDSQLKQTTSVPLSTTPLGILLADTIRLTGEVTVTGIAKACIEDPDARLRALLAETIAAAEAARAPLTERQLEPVR